MSKYVESHFVRHCASGIISLFITTKERWESYHQFNDTEYRIGPEDDSLDDTMYKIPEIELNRVERVMYIPTQQQDKYQIAIYFIPHDLLLTTAQIRARKIKGVV